MAQAQKTRLLVVEDDGLIRLDLVDILVDAGFDVIDAANADEAMVVFQNSQDIAALLTDIDMPGSMNGLELANRIHGQAPACKIIVISGRYHPDTDLLPSGSRFLTKPLSEAAVARLFADLELRPH
ncbi:response regulator receiver protein [Rhizobium sp. PDO1-076]|uniref:response regulator n=1 Tax=Rhizobium sp. PDO1-076 TaxID=1125979 RepID=UPI00024E34BB|nr:response regulator [Rhizobium sp. PDO1-076]EHS49530.1 response regulator receiver protein [Rhizobium sp. PDO1-076]